jgi:zinc D-Ala-D-Ala carboxypeptidase
VLAASMLLAPHFSAAELGADTPDIPNVQQLNLYTVAAWLEQARTVLGVPLLVTSGYRTPQHNREVGGASDSDHLNGLAADFEPQGLTPFQAYRQLKGAIAAGTLPPFDQLIFYAGDDHIHVGLGPQLRGELLVRLTEGSYITLTEAAVSKLRGFV